MSGPQSAMLAGREAAEALMVDECVITRPGGEPVYDPDTLEYAPAPPVTVYAGPCKVQRDGLEPRDAEAGEVPYAVESIRVDIPMATTGLAIGQTVRITRATYDPDLAGMTTRVRAVGAKTWATARRLRCSEEV